VEGKKRDKDRSKKRGETEREIGEIKKCVRERGGRKREERCKSET